MNQNTFKIENTFSFKCTADMLYTAITTQKGIASWWTDQCIVKPKESSEAHFYWKPHGWQVTMKISKLVTNERVEWLCLKSTMQNTNAWEGSTLSFRISSESPQTSTLYFVHDNYKSSPCFDECTAGWSFVLGKSLKNYLETGVGMPFENDNLK